MLSEAALRVTDAEKAVGGVRPESTD